jgi:hypothetical protein
MSHEANVANSSVYSCCADTKVKNLSLKLINALELLEVLSRSISYANMTNDSCELYGEEALLEQIYHTLKKVHDDLDELR